jgi:signal transduction histidine kinase
VLQLQSQPDKITLSIRDNGRGFDPDAVTDDKLGLGIMHERADEIGARLDVSSAPGKGTRIAVNWESQQTENLS